MSTPLRSPPVILDLANPVPDVRAGVAFAAASVPGAQKAFARAVKVNHAYRCAITGITIKDFLMASHNVPWSEDQSVRLDPSDGICLSLLVDRAFERGYLLTEDDLSIRIDWDKVGDDEVPRIQRGPYDGQKLSTPTEEPPHPEYLQRRRALLTPTD